MIPSFRCVGETLNGALACTSDSEIVRMRRETDSLYLDNTYFLDGTLQNDSQPNTANDQTDIVRSLSVNGVCGSGSASETVGNDVYQVPLQTRDGMYSSAYTTCLVD